MGKITALPSIAGQLEAEDLMVAVKDGQTVRVPKSGVLESVGTFLEGPGIDESGVVDSTAAIAAIVNSSVGPVYGVPGATYKVSRVILTKDDVDIRGNGAALTVTAGVNEGAFEATARTNISITGWAATGIVGASLLRAIACSVVDVLRNDLINISAFVCGSANGSIYAGSSETENNDIFVKDNTGVCTGGLVGGIAAVLLLYASDVIVMGNRFTDYPQGVQYWGGNANPVADGAAGNSRKCKRIWMTRNRIYGAVEGGLWGSMGEDISITDNYVETAGDVGIDFEGSYNCRASRNIVKNCGNANFATFSICRGIKFTDNESSSSTGTVNLLIIHNSTGDASMATGNREIIVTGNEFSSIGAVGSPIGAEALHDFVFKNNRCYNTTVFTRVTGAHNTTIIDNDFWFDLAAGVAINAIDVGSNLQTDGGVAPLLEIRGNRIHGTVLQPAGSIGINSDQADPNSSPVLNITDNDVFGFPTAILSQWGGTNPGTTPVTTIARNTLYGALTVTNTGASNPQALENYQNKNHAGAAFAPSRAVVGSRGGNAALASLITQLQAMGIILDSTTA